MANELALTATLAFAKNSAAVSAALSGSVDVAGDNFMHHVQEIGFAAEEAIDLGDVVAGGYFMAVNRDSAQNIAIRPDTAETDLISLGPGQFCLFPMDSGATPYAQSTVTNNLLEYWVFDV